MRNSYRRVDSSLWALKTSLLLEVLTVVKRFLFQSPLSQLGQNESQSNIKQLPSTTRLTHHASRHPVTCTWRHCVRLSLATFVPSEPRCFTGSILFCRGYRHWLSMLNFVQRAWLE